MGPRCIFEFGSNGTDARKLEGGINGLGNGGRSGAALTLKTARADCFLAITGFLAT